MTDKTERCNVQAMAEATYRKQCEFVGPDHGGYCIKLLADAYQSFEDRIEELEAQRTIQSDLLTDKCDELKALTDRNAKLERMIGWREYDHPEWFCRRTAEWIEALADLETDDD